MYITLHFNTALYNHTDALAKALTALVCGYSLAHVASNQLAGTSFVLEKSSRKATTADHFWTQDTEYIAHAPCDTVNAQNKYVRFSGSSHLMFELGTDITMTKSSTSYVYVTSYLGPAPHIIHLFVTKRCIVVAVMSHLENYARLVNMLSEITYETAPYLDDASGNFVPAVITQYTQELTSSSASITTNMFRMPNVLLNTNSQGQMNNSNTRIGETTYSNNPITRSVGLSKLNAQLDTVVEAVFSLGVQSHLTGSQISGSITAKSGIMVMSGTGYPTNTANSASKILPPDMLINVNGQDYFPLNRFLIPYI